MNIIYYDEENAVGYKKDIMEDIRKNLAKMLEDNATSLEDIQIVYDLLTDINEKARDNELIMIYHNVMQALDWKYVDITDIED